MSTHGKAMKIVLLTLLVLNINLLADSVKIKLNGTEVIEGSAIEVQIVAEGRNVEFPDIKDIGGFVVEGNRVSSKLESSYVNGNFSSKSLKTLSFEFYPETDMTIPAYDVKINGIIYKTEAVKIRVLKPTQISAKSVDGYSLRIKSDKKSIYVGEPFIVTVDFFEPKDSSVTKVEYTPPKFKNFFSQSLGGEKLKRSATGTLHQLQYLVTAKSEGNLTIMPPKARVGIRSFGGADRDPWGFFSNDIRWHSVRAKPLVVYSNPVPLGVDLIGVFKVESQVDKNTAKTNSPITYTLKIEGEGNLDDLANPKFDLPGVTVYGDEPKITSKVVGGKVVSKYERKYVFISDKDFFIPDLHFKNFDYVSRKSKTLKTKRHSIKIKSELPLSQNKKLINNSIKPQLPKESSRGKNLNADNLKKGSAEGGVSMFEDGDYYMNRSKKPAYSIWYLIIAFVSGILSATLALKIWNIFKNRGFSIRTKKYSNKEALKILYPHTNSNKKVEIMVRKLYEIERGNKSILIDRAELAKIIEYIVNTQELQNCM